MNGFKEHACPRCGNPTTGSQTAGGITQAICSDCTNKDEQEIKKEIANRGKTKGQTSA